MQPKQPTSTVALSVKKAVQSKVGTSCGENPRVSQQKQQVPVHQSQSSIILKKPIPSGNNEHQTIKLPSISISADQTQKKGVQLRAIPIKNMQSTCEISEKNTNGNLPKLVASSSTNLESISLKPKQNSFPGTKESAQAAQHSMKDSNSSVGLKKSSASTSTMTSSLKRISSQNVSNKSVNMLSAVTMTSSVKPTITIDRTKQKGMERVRGPNPNNPQNDKPKVVSNLTAKNSQGESVLSQFILSFQDDLGREFGLMFRVLSNAQLCVEDANGGIEKRKQYFLELNKEFPRMLDEVKTDECMQDSTQRMLRGKAGENKHSLKEESQESTQNQLLPSMFVELLQSKASRQILFQYLKLKQQELVYAKKEGGQLLNSCWKNDSKNGSQTISNFLTQQSREQQPSYLRHAQQFDKNSSRYHLLKRLGKGGQGEVWLYFDDEQKKTIVFKKYADDEFESYRNEMKILLKLKNSNLCPPIISCDDTNLTIQTEKGEASLRQYDDYLKQNSSQMYSQSELFYVLHWLVSAVRNLQKDFGIYHCDIKPDNIVLVPANYQTYRIQLIDFGGSVDEWQDYPGCYTPAFMNKEILSIRGQDKTKDVCVQFELYCVARTICKLALKDASTKKFQSEPFLKLIQEINVWQNGEYSEIACILRDIVNKDLKTCDQVLSRIAAIPNGKDGIGVADSIRDKENLVHKIQQDHLLAAQNNMTSEYLLQQISFYEQLSAFEKCIDIINILLSPTNKHAEGFSAEEKRDLIMKKMRFTMKLKGIEDLSNVIASNQEIFGKENSDFFELIQMVSNSKVAQNTEIDMILKKGASILLAHTNKQSHDSQEVFILQDILASLLERANRFSEAIHFREKNLEIARLLAHHQHHSISLFTTATQLAECYDALGRQPDALHYYKLAFESANANQEDIKNIANALQNIATFYRKNNAFQEAEVFQKQALEKRTIGTADYANSLSKLASIKEKQGHYKEAIDFYIQSLADLRKFLGNGNIDVGYVLNNLSLCYQQLGELNAARSGYLEAYAIMKDNLGEENTIVATCLGNLGDCYRESKEFTEAMNYAKKSLAISEKISGKDSLITSNSLEKIGLIYNDEKQYAKAIEFFKKALSIKQHHVSTKSVSSRGETTIEGYASISNLSYEISMLLNNLALANEGLEFYDNSLKLQLESLELKQTVFKTQDHPSIAISRGNLGMTYFKQNSFEKSKVQLELAIASLKATDSNKEALNAYLAQLEKVSAKINSNKPDDSCKK